MATSAPHLRLAAQAEVADNFENKSSQLGITRNTRTANIKKDKNRKHLQLAGLQN